MNCCMNNGIKCDQKKCYCCEPCYCYEPCGKGKKECKKDKKESAQFVSGYNCTSPCDGQIIYGYWPGNTEPVEFGITAIADGEKIKLSGNNTVVLQPGRYHIDTHALVANFDNWDPHGSDPIITKLYVNGLPLEYTTNSVDVLEQNGYLFSTQINKSNIINITQENSTLQWIAGNTVSWDFDFSLYEASITIIEI